MDTFPRTFLPAAGAAGVSLATVSRHLPVLSRCVEPGDPAVLVSRCLRPELPLGREFLLVLTKRRMVVTRQTRVLRRLRLHLNAELRHMSNVSWSTDPDGAALELAATAIDGVRERFWIKVAGPERLGRLETLLAEAFAVRTLTERTGPRKLPRFAPAAGF